MNQVILIGRLTKDPELRYTPSGKAVTTVTIAIDEYSKEEKKTNFIQVVVWGKQAENIAQYQTKGSLIAIKGRITTRSYDKDESKRYITEVVAEEVKFLDKKRDPFAGDNFNQEVN